MGPGLPGIGVASLFYVAAALFAPVREMYLTMRGRSSWRRWCLIGRQFILASAVVVAIIFFYWSIEFAISRGWILDRRNSLPMGLPAWIFAFIALIALLVGLAIWARRVKRHWHEYGSEVIARAHRLGVTDQVGIIAGVADDIGLTPKGKHLPAALRVAGRATRSIRDVDLATHGPKSMRNTRHTAGGRHTESWGTPQAPPT